MGKKFACASDWLVLMLVIVAAVVLVGRLPSEKRGLNPP